MLCWKYINNLNDDFPTHVTVVLCQTSSQPGCTDPRTVSHTVHNEVIQWALRAKDRPSPHIHTFTQSEIWLLNLCDDLLKTGQLMLSHVWQTYCIRPSNVCLQRVLGVAHIPRTVAYFTPTVFSEYSLYVVIRSDYSKFSWAVDSQTLCITCC